MRRLRVVATTVVLAMGMAGVVVAGERLPAELLYRPPLLTPVEAAGTGLAPTLDLRVTVGVDGRVAGLEVLSVSPSSDLDGLFAGAVRSNLERWRFAPAMEAARPVESQLSWSFRFEPAESGTGRDGFEGDPAVSAELGGGEDLGLSVLVSDAPRTEDRLLRIFTLPVEQQQRHLQHLAEAAEEHIRPETRTMSGGDGFLVVTDHPSEGSAEILHHNVAAVFRTLAELLFGDELPLSDRQTPIIAFVYSSQAQYQALIASVDGILETAGYFCPPGLIALHAERSSREVLLSTVIHEAVHAFVYRHVVTPGRGLPRWLNEGFADYVGNSRIRKGRLELGEGRVTQFYTAQARVWRGRTLAQLEVDTVKRLVKRGEALPLEAILDADARTFYGDAMSLYYAQSWLLVHLLRHGEDDWAQEIFPELMLYAAEGFPAGDIVESVYGFAVEDLEERYREYVRSF